MRKNIFYRACFVLGFCIALPAVGQTYHFTKILDGNTQRPDGLGVFVISVAATTPSFDGRYLVFRDPGLQNDGGSHSGIWAFDTTTAALRKLVSWDTTVPGSTALFNDLQLSDTAPTVRNGTVIFVARDTTTGTNRQGLYSVPAAGGAVVKIADYDTTNPSGGTFTVFDSYGQQSGAFTFDGTTVAFNANGSTVTLGDYSAKPDGSSLGLIADSKHAFTASQGSKVTTFNSPVISGNNVVMIGTDTAKVYHGIYLGTVGGAGAVTELVNSTQQLPGNTNSNFHTRFDAPVLGFDGTLVAFRADDSNSPASSPFYGLYTTDLTSHAISKIADVNSTLPGLGKLNAIADTGVAVNQGSVLFRAADTSGKRALFIWKNGSVSRVIGTGDVVDGQTVQDFTDPGPAALFASGFAFNADFGSPTSRSIYYAKPSASTVTLAAVTNAASYGSASIAPGEIVSVWGTGMGPDTLAYSSPDSTNHFPTTLSGTQVFFAGHAAPLIFSSAKQVAAIVPFEVAGLSTADVTVQYSNNTSAVLNVPVTNTMPGVFSSDFSGSGLGAIQNFDQSYNSASNAAAAGTDIVLYLTGLGQLNPAQPTGLIVPGTNLPALVYPVTVTVGGKPCTIAYQGAAPLEVAGVYQVNCTVPTGLASGHADVVVTGDGRPSQPNLFVNVK